MININTAQALGQMKNKIILIHSENNLATYCHFILCIFFLVLMLLIKQN